MQMIMFFVDSDASGGTHITRTTKRTRRQQMDIDRPVPKETEVVVVDQRTDRLALPKRLEELTPQPQHASSDEEDIERWDGLY